MRALLTCFLILAWAPRGFPSDAAAPAMPAEVTLTTGRVLRQVSVIRWEKDRVVLKHAAGADPIAFALIAEPLRSQLPAIRAAAPEKKPAPPPEPEPPAIVSGVAYDRGVDQPYIFAGLRVVIYPAGKLDHIHPNAEYSRLPEGAIAETKTDVHGKFELRVPAGKYQLFAKGTRHYRHGATRANYTWLTIFEAKGSTQVTLDKDNAVLVVDILR